MIEIKNSELFCRRLFTVSEFLENDQIGILIDSLKKYCENGTEPSFNAKAMNYAWLNMVDTLDTPTTKEPPKKRGRKPKSETAKFDILTEYKKLLNTDDVTKNTLAYIEYFLTPKETPLKGNYQDFWEVIQMDNYNVCENYIRNHIKMMDYHDFLKTDWWCIVRAQKRAMEHNTCERCGCTDKTLHIHHPNYEIRGYEDKYLDVLQCLCEECHQKEHNIMSKEYEEFVKEIMLSE